MLTSFFDNFLLATTVNLAQPGALRLVLVFVLLRYECAALLQSYLASYFFYLLTLLRYCTFTDKPVLSIKCTHSEQTNLNFGYTMTSQLSLIAFAVRLSSIDQITV